VPSARVCMGTIQRDIYVGVGGRVHLLLACVNLQVVLHNWTGNLRVISLKKYLSFYKWSESSRVWFFTKCNPKLRILMQTK